MKGKLYHRAGIISAILGLVLILVVVLILVLILVVHDKSSIFCIADTPLS